MPNENQLPGVRNGEPCPGCHTSIYGAQPKRCFMCGYDFENPGTTPTLEEKAQSELAVAQGLNEVIESQKEIEKSAKARIEQMVNEFLKMNWPEDPTTWQPAFMEAVKKWWPEATFYDVLVEAWQDGTKEIWYKHITGSMDLTQQRVVGFKFDYGLKRQYGAKL